VIFSSAHYLEREANSLASACGVSFILYNPCDPEIVLRTVDTALGLSEPPAASLSGDGFDCEHLHLLIDQLSRHVDELRAVDQKLAALTGPNRAPTGPPSSPRVAPWHAMAGDRGPCLAAGMDGHVAKPIRATDLYASLSSPGYSGARLDTPRWIAYGR
jgi:hypothetical protein